MTELCSQPLCTNFATLQNLQLFHNKAFSLLLIHGPFYSVQFSSAWSLSRVQLFATPWTSTCQASLSITKSQGLLKLRSIESVMPSNHLILCRLLLFLPSIFPSIRVFSNDSVLVLASAAHILKLERYRD